MKQVNLLKSLPKSKRKVSKRAFDKTDQHIKISREYGKDYFDGDRSYGYGGYSYDGRWQPVARDIINHFKLKPGDRVLDIGAAKGFLVKDLNAEMPGLEAFGTDISNYALVNCEEEVIGRLHQHDLNNPLPFPDNSFDVTLCINTLHNLKTDKVIEALVEMERVTKNSNIFVQVDSYRNDEEKVIFEDWVLTAIFHTYPEDWIALFKELDYDGDYYWTVV